VISIEVFGLPAPKGSFRAINVRGRAQLVPGGSSQNQKALRAWAKAIEQQARAQIGERSDPLYQGIAIEAQMIFRLPRPASHYGAKGLLPSAPPDHWHIVKPDGDKLARATLDALTGIVYDDDARIPVQGAVKQWCHAGQEGAVITLRALPRSLQHSLDLSMG
jgi:Holliday junction resolvase RusA-like endonuclease